MPKYIGRIQYLLAFHFVKGRSAKPVSFTTFKAALLANLTTSHLAKSQLHTFDCEMPWRHIKTTHHLHDAITDIDISESTLGAGVGTCIGGTLWSGPISIQFSQFMVFDPIDVHTVDVALTAESYINVAAILGRARLPYKHEQVKAFVCHRDVEISDQ